MEKKKFLLIYFSILLLLSGCISDNKVDYQNNNKAIQYSFKEPRSFPFIVNEVSTDIDIEDPKYLHQFVFHYRNNKSNQEIRYILSKVLDKPEKIDSKKGLKKFKLKNGLIAFYEEDATTQTIWWEKEDGFLARITYGINGNTIELKENKLMPEAFVNLANEVQ